MEKSVENIGFRLQVLLTLDLVKHTGTPEVICEPVDQTSGFRVATRLY